MFTVADVPFVGSSAHLDGTLSVVDAKASFGVKFSGCGPFFSLFSCAKEVEVDSTVELESVGVDGHGGPLVQYLLKRPWVMEFIEEQVRKQFKTELQKIHLRNKDGEKVYDPDNFPYGPHEQEHAVDVKGALKLLEAEHMARMMELMPHE